MFELRAHVPVAIGSEVTQALAGLGGVDHVVAVPEADGAHVLVIAEVDPTTADATFERLEALGVPVDRMAIVRLAEIPPIARRRTVLEDEALVWADLVAEARQFTQPARRYLAMMAAAGVIAAFGVMGDNTILIVGAMAVSPDLLPIIATCVGIAGRRRRLALRGFGTLVVGLAAAGLAGALLTLGLSAIRWLPATFALSPQTLGTLVTVDLSSVIIALTAGIAGMLAFETRASSAVGVAISVTTIPAVAYFSVAVGTGSLAGAGGALAVLGVNVTFLLVGGTLTLLVQEATGRRGPRATSGDLS